MKLAIVGSRELDGDPRALEIIEGELDLCKPEMVISGGAVGIDRMAVESAKARGIPTREFFPQVKRWDGGELVGFKQRNMLIVEACDRLVRVAARYSRTYGSGWTKDYAAKLGKPVEEYVLP